MTFTASNTPYINTIPPEQQPHYPGDLELERRIRSFCCGENERRRWNGRWSRWLTTSGVSHACFPRRQRVPQAIGFRKPRNRREKATDLLRRASEEVATSHV